MGWWSWLFGSHGPEPVPRVDDPTFGPLSWSEDDEAWVGEYGGNRIAIDYSGAATPAPELLAHVREFLGPNGATFTRSLAEQRAAHAHEFKRWAAEFAGLQVGTLRFHISNRRVYCLVNLVGGGLERSWRVEFDGKRCLGFGFDR